MNWDMLGHEWAVELLKEHIVQDKVRHAYLLVGSPGIGRRTLGLRFAQALNCLRSPDKGEFCGSCRICDQIARMQHADLAIVQSEQTGESLKVEQIRELQHSLALAAYEANYRVAMILRFEEATISAMNALLKTLEEPAPRVVLILTADSAESLLPTIVSRCEVLRLRPLPVSQISHGLTNRWQVPEEQSRVLAHVSAGRPGYALSLFNEPERLEKRKICLDDHWMLLSANRVTRFSYAEKCANDAKKSAQDRDWLNETLRIWLSLWRDVLLQTLGTSNDLVNLDRKDEIDTLASRYGTQQAYQMVTAINRSLDLIGRNSNIRLTLEVLMLDIPFL
jgi:DNA polymerase-3 subunit delta'